MPRQRRPYVPPACLCPDSEIVVSLAGSAGSVHATVVRHLPFTFYQVVLCELISKSGIHPVSLRSGMRFILKTFDPRYLRRTREDAPQWSYASERDAYPRHRGQLTKRVFASSPFFAGMSNWDEFCFLKAKTHQTCEVESYQHLTPFQGSAVPIFYGHGDLDLSFIDPERTIHPPVILIEYIDNAVTLAEVDARVLDASLVESFVRAVDRMGKLGASNNDLNDGNYLFAPAHKPDRILLIDWADAGVREPEESDEQWGKYLACNGAFRYTKRVLAERFALVGLPVPGCCV